MATLGSSLLGGVSSVYDAYSTYRKVKAVGELGDEFIKQQNEQNARKKESDQMNSALNQGRK